MKEERMRILSMLQEGKITAAEAERLLNALSGGSGAGGEERSGRGRRPRGFWDFDIDFDFGRFGPVFDDEFRRKFQDKMRHFRHSMRCADEEARREAREALREAAQAVKDAVERSNIKETVENIGKTVLDAMEEAMRRFEGDKPEERRDEPPGPAGDSAKADTPQDGAGSP